MKVFLRAGLALWLIAAANTANARVVEHSTTGFSVIVEVEVSASPADAYASFLRIGDWWASDHSFSGDSKNFTLETKPGGCWCETLPDGGFVRHAEVIYAAPGQKLVLSGGLGPLQSMGVTGTMVVVFSGRPTTTNILLTYSVGGHDAENFEALSKAVDEVFTTQLGRLANLVTNGAP
jgi:hypothetical protein